MGKLATNNKPRQLDRNMNHEGINTNSEINKPMNMYIYIHTHLPMRAYMSNNYESPFSGLLGRGGNVKELTYRAVVGACVVFR